MRIVCLVASALLMAAGPSWSQTPSSVTGPRNLKPAHVICMDSPVSARPQPTLVIKGTQNPVATIAVASEGECRGHRPHG